MYVFLSCVHVLNHLFIFSIKKLDCFENPYHIFMQRTKDLDTTELLEQLPALQQLLFRVLGCQVIFKFQKVPVDFYDLWDHPMQLHW